MASIVDTNWQNFLAPDSDLPPDVVFLVKADGIERRFGAHRLFLAGVSPVFRAMLFGPMKETEKVVEVKDTTPQAFGTMIDYIYRAPDSDFSLEDIKCPQELFELLAVADRYEILILVELTIEALEFFDITNENMIFAATVAQKYRLLHVDVLVDVSKRLLLKCLNFLNSSTNGRDIYALVAETKKNFPEASLDVLYELIDLGNETYGQPGWGRLAYYDPDEHKITNNATTVARISKMASEWKIIQDFKPTDYPASIHPRTILSLSSSSTQGFMLELNVLPTKIAIDLASTGGSVVEVVSSNHVPKLNKWNRIEITYEEEGGKYFLSVSVNDKNSNKEEVTDNFDLGSPRVNFNEIEIMAGYEYEHQPGVIKGITVLEKL